MKLLFIFPNILNNFGFIFEAYASLRLEAYASPRRKKTPRLTFPYFKTLAVIGHSRIHGLVGLKGEAMNIMSSNPLSSLKWTQHSLIAQTQQPLTWHKAYFDAPDGDDPLVQDMNSMGKGKSKITDYTNSYRH